MTKSALRVMWVAPPAVVIAASWNNRQDFSLDSRRAQSSDAQYEAHTDGRGGAVVTSIDNVLHWSQRLGLKDFVVVVLIENTIPLNLIGSPTFANSSDLRGADILVDAQNNGFVIALRVILKNHGLELNDYRLTPVGGVLERYFTLVVGEGDAISLGPPFDSLAVGREPSQIVSAKSITPDSLGQGVIVRKSVAENLDSLSVWLQYLNQALDIIAGNTEKLMTSLQAQEVPAEAAIAVVESSPKTLSPDVNGMKCLIVHRLKLGLHGLLGANSNYEQIVDCSLLS